MNPKKYGKNILCILPVIMLLALGGVSCKTPPKPARIDPEILRSGTLAKNMLAAGKTAQAAESYQKALRRAREIDHPQAVAQNAYNLAVCLAMLGQFETAHARLNEAQLEFRRLGAIPPEVKLLEAGILRAEGRAPEARQLVAEELHRPNDVFRVQFQILLAGLLLEADDAAGADAILRKINLKKLAECRAETRAEFAQLNGTRQLALQNYANAARQFDDAAEFWRMAGRFAEMAVALEKAAGAHEAAGAIQTAAERYYRAARSFAQSGQTAPALNILEHARAFALPNGMQQQMELLRQDIQAPAEK